MIVKMNEIVLDMDEVESIEWKHDGGEAYSVRFHMKKWKDVYTHRPQKSTRYPN